MYLEKTIKDNKKIIETAVKWHQAGKIPSNTYLIDLDMVKMNAEHLVKEAKKYNIRLYCMTKHYGRDPITTWSIVKTGVPKAVCCFTEGARHLNRFKIPIGHVGHLVPVPRSEIEDILDMNPEAWTVFCVEKAKQISDIAQKKGKVQKILLRIREEDSIVWPNEDGGFKLNELEQAYSEIKSYKGVEISGVTAFPSVLFNEKTMRGEPTINFKYQMEAAKILKKLGANIVQINTPADTSTKMLKIIHDIGGTDGEPGNAFTGTSPWGLYENIPEKPAMIYINEVSHLYGSRAFVPGGGHYACNVTGPQSGYWYNFRRNNKHWVPNALVGNSPDNIFDRRIPVLYETFLGVTNNATDYISELYPEPGTKLEVGDTVIYGFRAAIFVTRAFVAVAKGIQSNKPELLGIFNRANDLLDDRLYPIKNTEEKVEEILSKI